MGGLALPHNGWLPRSHQLPLWTHLRQAAGKRALAIWHRRAGKDEVCLHSTAVAAMTRPGNYWHCLPEYLQGRKAIWTAINPHTGHRRIDEAFPAKLRTSTNDNEMFIRFRNGSTWQVVGSDRYDATVGASVAGVVYSEWALANPSAWAYHRPMLEENNGWAVFITTPRGRNHAKAMFDHAQKTPGWFCELLTAIDTKALSSEALAEALAEYRALYGHDVGTAQYEQEYMCSFNAAILGSFYAFEMAQLRAEGRVLPVKPLPDKPVHRAWDLGVGDDTSIWWFQAVGAQLFILDHYAASGVGLEHYRDVIEQRERERGWKHGDDYVPHDAKIKEWGSGRTRVETMQSMGLHPMLVPNASIDDGINAVRRALPLCVFHPRTEDGGISALEQYRREWDDDKKAFRASAVHDWCFTGDTEVLTRYGTRRMMDLPATGEVLTPCGWKQYRSPRITRRDARLVEVQFADGLTVRCTPDHLFKTASGWISAECLTSTTPIQSCLTLSRNISMAVSTAYFRARCITRAAAESCTALRGRLRSVLFPMGVTSITATAISKTTASPTWNVFQAQNIGLKLGRDRIAGFHRKQGWRPLPGINQTLVCYGTSATPSGKRAGRNGSANHWLARLVARSSTLWFERAGSLRSIAARIAGSRDRVVTSVRPLAERADVWCLTVPDGACFALANGAAVGNCSHPADAFRYLALSWRPPPLRQVKVPKRLQGWIIPPPPEPQRGIRL